MENLSKSYGSQLNKGDIVYYSRIMPTLGVFDVYELIVRTVTDTYFVGMEKRDKRVFLFSYSAIGDIVFSHREDAVDKAMIADDNAPKVSKETYYEEY